MNLQQNLRLIPQGISHIARENKRIVIDFSSPNIAKPFHFGHLKSTILGNFLANIHKHYGNEVVKLNYVGDWGVQYGLLSLGLKELGNHRDLNELIQSKNFKLNYLLDIYVRSNKRAADDQDFSAKARQIFKAMDDGQEEELRMWREIRDVSLDELKSSYSRLGIRFDVFEHESDHSDGAKKLIEEMKALRYANHLDDGVLVTEVSKNNRTLSVPIQKSDGSTLYMTRDVAAAFYRKEKYNFDQMLYVVGSDQEKHFHCLREIVRKFDGSNWADNLIHVKTGKVLGMSSRAGDVLLLSDIIDEATQKYIDTTKNVPTSKVHKESDIEEVGKNLALSAVFIFDMRNKRTRNYQFDWTQVMVAGERSGIHMQTTFARLCSLVNKAKKERDLRPYQTVDEINYDSICCIEGVHLINVMNSLDRKLSESFEALDPSPLVGHALLLCKAANRARRSDWLHVINEPDENRALSRLTLFESCRSQLEFIIKMLGLKPCEKV